MGYLRIRGELLNLGIDVSATTIATVLREGGLSPAPRRIGPTWTQFLRLQAHAVLSSAPHSEEEDLQDLENDRQRQMPAPVKEEPTADTRIHRSAGPPVPRGHPLARPALVGRSARNTDSRPDGLRDSRSRRATHGRLSVGASRGVASPSILLGCTVRIGRLDGRPRARAVFVETKAPESELTSPPPVPRDRVSLPHTLALVGCDRDRSGPPLPSRSLPLPRRRFGRTPTVRETRWCPRDQ